MRDSKIKLQPIASSMAYAAVLAAVVGVLAYAAKPDGSTQREARSAPVSTGAKESVPNPPVSKKRPATQVYRPQAAPAVAPTPSKVRYWVNGRSYVRHNSRCRWYGTTRRGFFTQDRSQGRGCRVCGG